MNEREAAYAGLVQRRKACRACAGLTNPAAVENGIYDSGHLGPWSAWTGNVNARILIVGQDWADERAFRKCNGVDDDLNPTNRRLLLLLGEIGIHRRSVFLTNALLCLKREGGMQGAVKDEWFGNCGSRFLRPTIDLFRPTLVVTLGVQAWESVRRLYGLPKVALRTAVEATEGVALNETTRSFPMYHCGNRVVNTVRNLGRQRMDWRRLGDWLSRNPL